CSIILVSEGKFTRLNSHPDNGAIKTIALTRIKKKWYGRRDFVFIMGLTNMTDIGRYVTLIKRVETDYPNWTTSRLLDSLRQLAGNDNGQFQTLYGGVGTEATSAELHGDIDVFLIGNWLSTTTAGQNVRTQLVQGNRIRLSQIIAEYYRTTTSKSLGMKAGSGYDLESIRRFSNFNATLKFISNELYSQTMTFNAWYSLARLDRRGDSVASIKATTDFIKWCDQGGGI
ncbi:MAG: hypothetical protein WA902_16645, partial [Thermosynechococcaceae cyanobacterium]